jgi:hypothetical protein
MRLIFIPLIFFCILFTGCFDIMEEVVLNKNGSGQYSIKIDMSGMFKNPMLKGLMEGDSKDAIEDMDSVVYLKDMPDSMISDNPDLWKRVSMKIFSNAEKELLYTSIHLDFKSPDEITYLSENFEKVMNKSKGPGSITGDLMSGGGPSGFLAKGLTYSLTGKTFSRKSEAMSVKEEEKENLEMMKAFLDEATYQVNYTMPGKIKKVNIPNASINGKQVSTKVKMMELMENKVSLDGSILFK